MNKIFVDGSCFNNGRPNAVGGWAYIVVNKNNKEIARKYGKMREGIQDSNRAEIEAFIQALKFVKKNKGRFTIYTDNEAIVLSMKGKIQRLKNRDLWEEVEEYCSAINYNIKVEHVPSHQNQSEEIEHVLNNQVDKLAKMGATDLTMAHLTV